jgi:hypothetical protein
MYEELNRVDNIAKYYFLGTSLFFLFIAGSCLTSNITWFNVIWFSVVGFVISFIHFLVGMGLIQRKKWGLRIARWLVGIDVFNSNPFSEWLTNLKDNRLDQFFR